MKPLNSRKTDVPGLFRRGDIWYYQFMIAGKRYKGTTGTSDRTEAVKIAAKVKDNTLYDSPGKIDFIPATAFPKLVFRQYKERKLRTRTEKTKSIHENFALRYLTYFGNTPLGKIDRYQVEAFRDWLLEQPINHGGKWKTDKRLSPKTVIEILHWLKAICRYFEIVPNPVDNVELPRKTKEQILDETITFFTDEQMNAITEASKGTVFELPLIILLNTGCRPAELHYLHNTPKEIDKEHKIIRFIDKRNRVRGIQLTIPPFNLAWDAILKWIELNDIKEGEALFPDDPNWMRKRWHTVLNRAKMPECRVHQLRHQFIKKCFYDYGHDLTWLSKWCGHSTDTAFRVYSNLLVQAPKTVPGKEDIVVPLDTKRILYTDLYLMWKDFQYQVFVPGEINGIPVVTISRDDFEYLTGKKAMEATSKAFGV